jgi:negative regulator of sigma E activity
MNPAMSARSWAVTAVGSLLLTGASTAAVTPWASAEGANPTVASSEAVATLQRASQAARSQPYSGTQFLSAWTRGATTSVVVNVIHVPGRGSLVQVPATADGVGASILESDSGPSAADGPAGLDGSAAALPGLDAEPLALLQRNYDVSMAPAGSCAGRPASVVEVRRRGVDASLAGRFWVDQRTGLVLRREVFDTQGRTVRASAFGTVDTDAVPTMSGKLPPTSAKASGESLSAGRLNAMRSTGWTAPDRLGADLELYDTRATGAGRNQTLHLSYSDGLSTLSLFEQPGRLDAAAVRGWRRERIGAADVFVNDTLPQRVAWAGNGTVYTMVADAPGEMIDAVVAALPHEPEPARGVLARMRHGLVRVGSWLNPFG